MTSFWVTRFRDSISYPENSEPLFALIYLQKHEFILEKTCFQRGFIKFLKNISFVKEIALHQKIKVV